MSICSQAFAKRASIVRLLKLIFQLSPEMVLSEPGVATPSGVPNGDRVVRVTIAVMQTLVSLRQLTLQIDSLHH